MGNNKTLKVSSEVHRAIKVRSANTGIKINVLADELLTKALKKG